MCHTRSVKLVCLFQYLAGFSEIQENNIYIYIFFLIKDPFCLSWYTTNVETILHMMKEQYLLFSCCEIMQSNFFEFNAFYCLSFYTVYEIHSIYIYIYLTVPFQ